MLTNCEEVGQVSILQVASNRLTAADLRGLKSAVDRELDRGRASILFDLGGVRRMTRSGLAALVELHSQVPRGVSLGFFGAKPQVTEEILRCPLSSLLSYHSNRSQALDAPEFRQHRLAGLKAVILCAGAGTRMRPLSDEMPKPMLDVAGKSALLRNIEHLGRFGIRDIILNPGHHGPQIHGQFATNATRSIQFANEGVFVEGGWQARPLGSASTLVRLQARQSAFDTDFVVMCGDALSDIDVSDMIEAHRSSGADVTIAVQKVARKDVDKYGVVVANPTGRIVEFCEKPSVEVARSTLISTGIYVFSPRALIGMLDEPGQDIGKDLLPRILGRGGHLHAYEASFAWADLGNPHDYFRAQELVMRGEISGATPEGSMNREGVWCAPTAHISRQAVIVGPCFIAAGAQVSSGAHIEGPAVIGAGAQVSARSVVKNAMVQPDTLVQAGAWVQNMIVSKSWALDLNANIRQLQSNQPLEGVVEVAPAEGQPRAAQIHGG